MASVGLLICGAAKPISKVSTGRGLANRKSRSMKYEGFKSRNISRYTIYMTISLQREDISRPRISLASRADNRSNVDRDRKQSYCRKTSFFFVINAVFGVSLREGCGDASKIQPTDSSCASPPTPYLSLEQVTFR